MLLPSALSCDLPQVSTGTPTSVPLSSPHLSPQDEIASSRPGISNIYNTCYALQKMLAPVRSPPIPIRGMTTSSQTYHSPKIRTRKRIGVPADRSRECLMKRRKYITHATMTRSMRKQTKNIIDDGTSYEFRGVGFESENNASKEKLLHDNENDHGPKTPKRRFYAPDILPFGLQHTDFLDLERHEMSHLCQDNQTPSDNNEINDEWSTDEDGLLVQLLRQKLKLTRSEWYDSAYRYGRDCLGLDKRW